jgi:hypothetical protein
VLDASSASASETEAWRRALRRLNERRNVLARTLGAPLVVLLPTDIERLLSSEAPDLWSVRSGAFSLPPNLARPSGESPAATPAHRPADVAFAPSGGSRQHLDAAEARHKEDPDDPVVQRELMVALGHAAIAALQDLRTSDARLLSVRALAHSRSLSSRDPERPESLRDVSVSLDNVGRVAAARGDWASAGQAYEESLQLSRRLLSRDPERPESLRDVSVSLNSVGRVAEARGQAWRRAIALSEAARLMEVAAARSPTQPFSQDAERMRTESMEAQKALGAARWLFPLVRRLLRLPGKQFGAA